MSQKSMMSFFGGASKTPSATQVKRGLDTPSAAQAKRLRPDPEPSPAASATSSPGFASPKPSPRPAASRAVERPAPGTVNRTAPSTGTVFPHLTVPWLTTDRKDNARRSPSHPDYDQNTLYLPNGIFTPKGPYHTMCGTGLKKLWWELKSAHMDTVLLLKVGKFYEMYNMDADVGVQVLGLTYMTGGAASDSQAHCGFPEMAYAKNARALAQKGFRVARVEQTETPEAMQARTGKKSGLVRREVCQRLSPGTCVDGELLNDHVPKYLLTVVENPAVRDESASFGVCIADCTTGTFEVGFIQDDTYLSRMATLLAQLQPAEVLFERNKLSPVMHKLLRREAPAALKSELGEGAFWGARQTISELGGGEGGEGAKYFGESRSEWPQVVAELAEAWGEAGGAAVQASREQAGTTLSALGGCVSYLRLHLIDEEIVSMKNFARYTPFDGAADATEDARHAKAGSALGSQRTMVLDANTLTNLEILRSESGDPKASLLHHLDHCSTPFGKRLFSKWVQNPLYRVADIERRLDAVEELCDMPETANSLRRALRKLPDLERLLATIHVHGTRSESHPMARAILYEDMNLKRLASLRTAIEGLKAAHGVVSRFTDDAGRLHGGLKSSALKKLLTIREVEGGAGAASSVRMRNFEGFPDVCFVLHEFETAFDLSKLSSGHVVPQRGVDPDYDAASREVQAIEARLQGYLEEQMDHFGSRDVQFFSPANQNERYQLQVPFKVKMKVGREYTIKSSTSKFKRYYTPAIVHLVSELEGAEEARDAYTKKLLKKLFNTFDDWYPYFKYAAECLANLDCLCSLYVCCGGGSGSLEMCRPTFVEPPADGGGVPLLELTKAWHPVTSTFTESFIANDTSLGRDSAGGAPSPAVGLLVLTGPNMGGKSTLLRQTCIAVIMAQLGCHVPASACRLCPVDRIFTRMGARDNIMTGESTFMVELSEAAIVLRSATRNALVVMDELGRGTSTFDGVSIAYAVAKHLASETRCRTVFSTHYHTLMEDFELDPAMRLGHMSCFCESKSTAECGADGEASAAEYDPNADVTFLFNLVEGACPRSFGMNVARLAGLPEDVISRAAAKSRGMEEEERRRSSRHFHSKLRACLEEGGEGPAGMAALRALQAQLLSKKGRAATAL